MRVVPADVLAAPADVYEPWSPQVGQRVAVRVSPECPLADGYHLDPANPEEHGWLERDTGTVVAVGDADFRATFPGGHWYGVELDDSRDLYGRVAVILGHPLPSRAPEHITPDDWYAACELIPIDDDETEGGR